MSLRADAFRRGNLLFIKREIASAIKLLRNDRLVFVIVAIFLFGLTACTPLVDVEPTRAPTLAGSLQPYQSPVPSVTPLPATPAPTQTLLPIPTPHLYQIASGDTMGSIALEFGVTVEALIVSNPDVQPSAMSVGESLLIPDNDVEPSIALALAPIALELSLPVCYPSLSGGMWCFVSVQNATGAAVESISAEIRLFDEGGSLLKSEVAFALVDRLPAEEAFSLLAFFADVPANVRADATLLTAFEVSDEKVRYLPTSLRNVLTQISWDGSFSEISGEVVVEGDASQFWVVATVYDDEGNVVGMRRWESVSGEKIFNLTVASVGHAIERVELIVEAKP